MKITDVVCHVLLAPGAQADATSSAQDDLVVEVHTDEGITGVGETDTNPHVARACIEVDGTHTMGLGLKEMLIGLDPADTENIWERLYRGSAMTGRRGAGICAMGAIDMALWDIKGKAAGVPCWQLLGGAQQKAVTPYASLQPHGNSVDAYTQSMVEWVLAAKSYGFKAAKLEASFFGPYAHLGLSAPASGIIDLVAACRDAVGPDFELMLDVQYAWSNAREALPVLRELEPLNLFFVETPLWIDDLEGYAFLHDHCEIKIAAGEWQNTRFEFIDLLDRALIDVAQPDVGRVGGLTEAMRVCAMAKQRDRLIVPHCWKTGIGIAASVHMAAATEHCPYVEYLPPQMCDSVLRSELVEEDLKMTEGRIALPMQSGLGVTLNRDALEKYSDRNIVLSRL